LKPYPQGSKPKPQLLTSGKMKKFKKCMHCTKRHDPAMKCAMKVKSLTVKKAAQRIRLLHDLLCPVYEPNAVKSLNKPLIKSFLKKNGVAGALGPQAMKLIYQILSNEVMEDAGTGKEAQQIYALAKAYAHLEEFMDSEISEIMDEKMFMSIRSDLHKSFQLANMSRGEDGSILVPPSAASATGMSASRFKRPLITVGQASPTAHEGGSPHIPDMNHVPEAGDFDRGPLTEGHERPSMANKGVDSARVPAIASARERYRAAARAQVENVLNRVHNHLQHVFPELCLMESEAVTVGEDSIKPMGSESMNMRQDDRPESIMVPHAPASPGEKGFTADMLKSLTDQLRNQFEPRLAAQEETINKQAKLIEELASQPDPYADKPRGFQGVRGDGVAEKVAATDNVKADGEADSDVGVYKAMAISTNPVQADWGRQTLRKMADKGSKVAQEALDSI